MKLSHQLDRLFGNCNAILYGSCCMLLDFLSTISGQTWFFSRTKDIVTLYNNISLANKFCNVCNDSSFQGARSIRRELAVTSSYSLNSLTSFLVQGGKTSMDKVSVLEARFSKKKRKNTTKRAPRRRVSGRKTKGKNPKRQWYKRKFKLGNFVKTPRRSTARKDDDRWFLSRKTTLNSLINKMKIAKIPLSQLLSK